MESRPSCTLVRIYPPVGTPLSLTLIGLCQPRFHMTKYDANDSYDHLFLFPIRICGRERFTWNRDDINKAGK